ncbi:Plasmodium vivax Vir protein, putative [Plasmodium ovale]|uniref:Plasmodium vivax Vir protein, putative n=1 Tax=Plasmodium ovale TaxID=36330 RepID=A0A1C3KKJ9_PLAOA|nr:Plasmodium vivax Vir protein, putative [Plasmodium ovale]
MPIPDHDSCELYADSIYTELKSNEDVERSKHFCENVKSFISKYPGMEKVCWEVASYLSYIGDKLLDNNKVKTYCSYVKYLLYYEIIKNKKIANHYEILSSFNIPWYTIISEENFSEMDNCRPEFPKIPIHYYEKWKKMFDYCINYAHIKEQLSPKNFCAKSYCQYIDENEDLYTEFTELCKNQDDDYCPPFFKDCENNIPSAILDLPQCSEYKKSIQDSQVTAEGDTVRESSSTLYPLQETQHDSSGPMSSSSPYSNTAMLTIFPTLSVLATSLLMYKLTPFGSWLRPHLQRMTKISNSSNKERNQSSYETEYNDINSNDGSYNIAYYA